jgi:hypothetical protein
MCRFMLHRYTVTPLQRYTVTTLHRYTVTTLHRYTVTPLKRYNVTPFRYTVTLHRYTVTTLHRNNVTTLHRYNVTPLQRYTVTPLSIVTLPMALKKDTQGCIFCVCHCVYSADGLDTAESCSCVVVVIVLLIKKRKRVSNITKTLNSLSSKFRHIFAACNISTSEISNRVKTLGILIKSDTSQMTTRSIYPR